MDGLTLTSQVTPPAPRSTNSDTHIGVSKLVGDRANNPGQLQDSGAVTQNTRAAEAESSVKSDAAPDVNDIINQLEKLAENMHLVDNTRLSISFRDDVSKFVYSGIDRDTGEVVTQYPSEDILSLMSRYHELTGLSVDIES